MNFNTLLYSKEQGVTTVTLNRPDRFNSFNKEMSLELQTALNDIENDESCRVVVLTGAGKAFCSGQDLKDIAGKEISFTVFLYERYNPIIKAMRGLEKPIICKLNGVAAGAGCSLALACDFIIADERASLIEVFVNVGLVLDSGSSFFLPRLIGSNRAFELATIGGKVSAQQAKDWGMINRVCSTEQLDDEVANVVKDYASAPTKAIGMMKKMLNASTSSDLDAILEMEAKCQEEAGNSNDYKEGVSAFIEKRKPEFRGT